MQKRASVKKNRLIERMLLPEWAVPLLGLYNVWQMGIVFFSSNALSLNGRTALPVSVEHLTVIVIAAYALSLAVLIFLQQRSVLLGRVCLAAAFVCILGLLLPLKAEMLALLIYAQVFLCVFFTGIIMGCSILMLDLRQTLKYCIYMNLLSGVFIPLLQNDLFSVSFEIFVLASLVITAALTAVFFIMPENYRPEFKPKSELGKTPALLTAGVYVFIAVSCLMALFGSSLVSGIKNGVAVYYISCGCGSLVFILLWRLLKVNPLKLVTFFLMASGLGFLLFIAAAYLSWLSLPACILTGSGAMACCLSEFFAASLFVRRPARFLLPVVIGIALGDVLLHSALLEALRNDKGALLVVCGAVSVVGTAVYLRMEPHIAYLWTQSQKTHIKPDRQDHFVSEADPTLACLTPQERAVADMIMRGYTVKEISERMNITVNTQKDYRKKLYMKLDVHSRSELFKLMGRD